MKNLLALSLFLWSCFAFSQSQITVYRAGTDDIIANATVLCDNKIVGKTNSEGKLTFKAKCKEVKVRAAGYFEDETVADKVMEARLSPREKNFTNIETVVLNDKSDERALAILKKVNENYQNNSPQSLPSYSFKSYEKISMDLDQDSIKSYNDYLEHRLDSLKTVQLPVQQQDKAKDSIESLNVSKMLTQSKMFLWERASEYLYSKKYGEKTNILDNRVSGLKNPIYEMLALRSNRTRIPREIREENRNLYRYYLTDSIEIDGRQNFVIRFRETNLRSAPTNRRFNGYLYIDTETYALKKIESNSKVKNSGTITSIWTPRHNKWFLTKESLKIKAGDMTFTERTADESGDKGSQPKEKKKKKEFGNYIYLTANFFDIKTPIEENAKDFTGYSISVKNADGSLMNQFRTDSLDVREKMTYVKLDSVGQKYNIDRKAGIATAAIRGKLRLGMVDLDLGRIFAYNKYEGFRLGVGAKLNERFNRYISPDAYVAYGFRDKAWKYGAGVDFRTSLERNSVIRAEYYHDVTSAGRFSQNLWSFKMNFMNGGIELNNPNFYQFTGYKLSYETDLSNSLTVRVSGKKDEEEAKFGYSFRSRGDRFENFATLVTLKYSPKSKNIMTPSGKYTYDQNYPELFVNYEQGLNALGGELNYSRFDALYLNQFRSKLGLTGLRLYGGLTTGEAPIWHHFTMSGLSGQQPKFNLNFTAFLGFATMEAGKYYNDKFAAVYLAHRIPWYFKSFGRNVSSFDLVYRGAIGNMKNPEYHNFAFEKMDHLYQEAGLEWNNFLSTKFNLGFFYRFGYYNVGTFKEDFAVQLKFQEFGF